MQPSARVVIATVILGLAVIASYFLYTAVTQTTFQFVAVDIWVSSSVEGSPTVYFVPFNAASPPSYESTYVVDVNGRPLFSHLFSSSPPLLFVFDPSAASRSFEVRWGTRNPYTDYTVPASSNVFLAYDDFDYLDTSMWITRGNGSVEVSGSLLHLTPPVELVLNATVGKDAAAVWSITSVAGLRALAITIYSQSWPGGWIEVRINKTIFSDWKDITNPDNIYFLGQDGNPLNHTTPVIDTEKQIIITHIYIPPFTGQYKIYMVYTAKQNPYKDYRLEPLDAKTATKTTQPPQQLTKITYTVKRKHIYIQQTIEIKNNTIIIPHIYTVFIGKGAYIVYPNDTRYNPEEQLSIYAEAKAIGNTYTFRDKWIIAKKSRTWEDNGYAMFWGWDTDFYVNIGTWGNNLGTRVPFKVFHRFFAVFNGTVLSLYINGTLKRSISTKHGIIANTYPLYVSSPFYSFFGFIRYIILWGKALPVNSIGVIVDSNGLFFFFEPTAYNGSCFVDVVTGNCGRPYGGVERVIDDDMWLWVIYGLGSGDGYVHFKWVPVGSTISVYDSSGRLIEWVKVYGPANPAGLVEDYPVYLPPGNYTIVLEADVPVGGATGAEGRGTSTAAGAQLVAPVWLPWSITRDNGVETTGGAPVYAEYSNGKQTLAWITLAAGEKYVTHTTTTTPPTPWIHNIDTQPATKTTTQLPWYKEQTLEANITVPRKINITLTLDNIELKGNDTIAPHLYTAKFTHGYIEYNAPNPAPTYFITCSMISKPIIEESYWGSRIIAADNGDPGSWALSYGDINVEDRIRFFYKGAAQVALDVNNAGVYNRPYKYVCGVRNPYAGTRYILIDWKVAASINSGDTYTASPPVSITIGGAPRGATYLNGWIHYVVLWSGLQSSESYTTYVDLLKKHIVLAKNLELFFDPTFYNGTNYISIAGGYAGTPSGALYRVPDTKTWLWIVKGLENDGRIHLRFFPRGSIVQFYNASTGELVAEYIIDGEANQAGLVEDYTVSLPDGNYTIIATIPIETKEVIIAPHLYSMIVDEGSSVKFKYQSTAIIRASGLLVFRWLKPNIYEQKTTYLLNIYEAGKGVIHIGMGWGPHNVEISINNGTVGYYDYYNAIPIGDNKWHMVYYNYTGAGNTAYLVVDGIVRTVNIPSDFGIIHASNARIGNDPGSRYRSFQLEYGVVIPAIKSIEEMSTHILDIKPIILVDPTFFNGTHYLDLVGGAVGTPYGGVRRVLAEKQWLWVVYAWGSFGKDEESAVFMFRFIPVWSRIEIYDSSGNLVYSGYVSGHVNAAGLVEEYKVSLPPGNYTVKIQLPPPYLKLELTATINANDVIAPHLYDWLFNGTGYISWNTPTGIAIDKISVWLKAKALRFRASGGFWSWPGNWKDLNNDGRNEPYNYFNGGIYQDYRIRLPESFANVTLLPTFYLRIADKKPYWWHSYSVVWSVYNFTRWVYFDGVLVNTVTSPSFNPLGVTSDVFVPVRPLLIGKHDRLAFMVERFLVVWRDLVRDWDNIIDVKPWILADPTFFNGTHYIDIASSYVGSITGTVYRVPTDEPFLWVIRGLASDGCLHFRFLPYGSIINIYREKMLSYIVTGSVNGAGLVEDFKVCLPSWWYGKTLHIVVYIPVYDGWRASASYESTVIGGERDAASFRASIDDRAGFPVVGGFVLPGHGFGRPTGVSGFTVWGGGPGDGLESTEPVLPVNDTVIVARVKGTGIGMVVLNTTDTENITPVAAIYDVDGYLFLDYYPDDTLAVNTSIKIPEDTWIVIGLAFEKPGRLHVLVWNGTYAPGAIYEELLGEYTYNATRWSGFRAALVYGAFAEPGSTRSSPYFDWVRVMPWPWTSIGLGETVSSLSPYTASVTEILWPTSNMTLSFTVNSTGYRVYVPLVNGSALILDVNGYESYDGVASGWAGGGTASISFNDTYTETVAAGGQPRRVIVSFTNGTLRLILYNASWSFTVPGVTGAVFVEAAGPVAYPAATRVPVTADYEPMYVSSGTTYAPGGAESTKMMIGWSGVSGNTSFTIAYNYTAARLEIYVNGSLVAQSESIGLTLPAPFNILLMWSYDENNRLLQAYAMLEWMSSGTVYYRLLRAEYNIKLNTTTATPFIDLLSGSISVNRFALLYGIFLKWLAERKAAITIAGPFYSGSIVKMFTVSGPVTITLVKGQPVIKSGGSKGITLVGFRGWELSLSLYGSSASGIVIPSDRYVIDVPPGFTAMLIVDAMTRTIAIVSASPPPPKIKGQGVEGIGPEIVIPRPMPPPKPPIDILASRPSSIILFGTAAALIIGVYGLRREIGLALSITGAAMGILSALLGQPDIASMALIAVFAGVIVSWAERKMRGG